jgi:hypothetical protein
VSAALTPPPTALGSGAAHPFVPDIRARPWAQLLGPGPTLARWRRSLRALLSADGGARALDEAARVRAARWAVAYESVPFWQARFQAASCARARLHEVCETLPPLERADVQAARNTLTPHVSPTRLPWAFRDVQGGVTSGSTGEPLRFRMSAPAYLSFFPVVDLALAWYGVSRPRPGAGYVLLDALGHSPEYQTWLPLFHGLRFSKITVGRTKWRERLQAAAPAVVTGDPDALAALLSVDVRPRLVLSSAFALSPRLRAQLVSHLRCPVVEYYSAAELGPLALRCPADGGWHVLTPYVHLSTSAPGASGTAAVGDEAVDHGSSPGRLLVDDLRNDALWLLRYAVGDRGEVRPAVAPCACGLFTPRLLRFEGRAAVQFGTGSDAPPWDPARLAPSLGRLGVDEYQVLELAPGRVRLVYRGPVELDDRTCLDLGARLRAIAGRAVRLELERRPGPWRRPGEKPRPFVPLAPATGGIGGRA